MSKIKDLVKMKICSKSTLECRMLLEDGSVIEKSFPAPGGEEELKKWINEFTDPVKLEGRIKSVITSIELPDQEGVK